VPARAIAVPGTRPKEFPAGTYQLSCALIIGYRRAATSEKTALNEYLREVGVSV
jgi:2,3,4,5-tetrahydropyridine-2-carboxylate N-succinyltransferase